MDISNRCSILFVIDVSGSMYGQNIASVNAVFSECLEGLKNAFDSKTDCNITVATFSETWQMVGTVTDLENDVFPDITVVADNMGFYGRTSFSCMYSNLKDSLDNENIISSADPLKYIFLLTDGKVIDSGDYKSEYKQVSANKLFKESEKYAVLVGTDTDAVGKDILQFVGNANNVIGLDELSQCLSDIQLNI